jgi:hypothetical protein
MVRNSGGDTKLEGHQVTLLVAALISLVLWVVPYFGFALLPLVYLNTHLHEFSHALVAALSGGDVGTIHVFANGSGVTMASGSPILVNAAGYLGATIIGGLMILGSRTERGAAITLRTIAVVLLFSLVFWVRGDLVGVVSGFAWMILLFALPSMTKGRNLVFVAQLLGMQQCLASVQALYVLFRISAYGEPRSDAGNMAQYTGIPAIFWAMLWGAIGLGVLYATLRSAWKVRPPAR